MYLLTKLVKYKMVLSIIFMLCLGFTLVPNNALAGTDDPVPKKIEFEIGTIQTETGLGGEDVRSTIASIIKVALGLLGIVAVVIILWGGFVWMTAGGNDEKVGEARKIIFSGIIGLAIVLSAYAIAAYVLNKLGTATMGSENYTEYTGTVE